MDFIIIIGYLLCMNSSVFAGWLWGENCPVKILENVNELNDAMENKLFGQHIVQQLVPDVIKQHISKENPRNALALSFHGTIGTGKTFVSKMIAEYIYEEGFLSKFVHVIPGNKYSNLHKLQEYKKELEELVVKQTLVCGRSLFIFSKIQDMVPGVLNVLARYLDYHSDIGGVSYGKNIFIFMSNIGGRDIRNVTLQYLGSGGKREDIPSGDLNRILYHSLKSSDFGKSNLILNGLVNTFVPFLPLERFHVRQCVLSALCKNQKFVCGGKTLEVIDEVANGFQYYSAGPVSMYGCKMQSELQIGDER